LGSFPIRHPPGNPHQESLSHQSWWEGRLPSIPWLQNHLLTQGLKRQEAAGPQKHLCDRLSTEKNSPCFPTSKRKKKHLKVLIIIHVVNESCCEQAAGPCIHSIYVLSCKSVSSNPVGVPADNFNHFAVRDTLELVSMALDPTS